MKLGEAVGEVAFCTEGLDVGTWTSREGFRRRGRLPVETDPTNVPFSLTTWGPTRALLDRLAGTITTSNVWHVRDDTLLATADQDVFRSTNGGYSWRRVHELPASSGPMGVLPTSVCVTDDAVYLAEYPLGDDPARVLVSRDDGVTWTTFHERDDVRHFHGVYRDPYTDTLWGTTGG
ncbi:WD40/YVTN/BNR-like repeat-containing protein, partial [Halomarina rubra]